MASGGGLLDPAGKFRSTIFDETSALAARHDAVNLGQGFPDTDGPEFMLQAAVQAIGTGNNQYTAAVGNPRLRAAVAAEQFEFQGRELDPQTQVLVTVGAAEGLAASLLSVVSPGQDVVVLEPFYDLYAAVVSFIGANLRPVPLRPPHFSPDPEQLRAAFSANTAAVILNVPHNPTGTVLDAATARLLAQLVIDHDAVLVTDEVYEHLRYDGVHTSLAAQDNRSPLDADLRQRLSERTLVVSSASKTLRATGWRVGWVTGPADLVTGARAVKTYLTHSPAAPFQEAVAVGLESLHPWVDDLAAEQGRRSQMVVETLREIGLTVADPAASYYVVADFSPTYQRLGVTNSVELSSALIEQAGVALLPVRAFASAEHAELFDGWMRVAACKNTATLQEAMGRLRKTLG